MNDVFLFFYSGGTEQAFYRMVRRATPIEEGPCGRPVVHDDGSIEYPKGDPPDIKGYRRDGLVFRPCLPSCKWRALSVTRPDNCFAVEPECQNPLAKQHLQETVAEHCQHCEFRSPLPTLK